MTKSSRDPKILDDVNDSRYPVLSLGESGC
jgi:hypothetical protein